METLGRREQNKQRTRSALEQAAARLFEEHGFAETTIRDIAVAAGVGERTFFRYFPSKESLVLQQARDLLPELMRRVRERPVGEAPNSALLESVVELLLETGTAPAIFFTGPPKTSEKHGGPDKHTGAGHALLMDLEDAVTSAFLDRFAAAGADPEEPWTRLRAVVQARAGVAALRGMMIVFPAADTGPCEGDGSAAAGDGAELPRPRGQGIEIEVDARRHGGESAKPQAGTGSQGASKTPPAPRADPSTRSDPESQRSPADVAALVRQAFAALAAE